MKFLEDLCKAFSPSSYEKDALSVWDDFFQHIPIVDSRIYPNHEFIDGLRNSVYSIGHGYKKILISAHIDNVCGRIVKITDKGTLMFSQDGGICLKSLISSHVIVAGDNGLIPGVVQKVALHLDEKRSDVGDWLDYRINIGCTSKKEVEDLGIFPGCIFSYRPEINTKFGGEDLICGTGLDDKAGVWIVGKVAKMLMDKDIDITPYTIYFAAMSQEEVGCVGAKRVARKLDPDYSIDIDCTFADTELVGGKYKDLDINLGDGAVISYGADKNLELCNKIREVAKKHNLKYKTNTTRSGGTNTKSIQDFSGDCITALLGYGLISMHSSTEIVNRHDLSSCVDLLYYCIKDQIF